LGSKNRVLLGTLFKRFFSAASVLCWNGLFFLLLLEVVGGNCRGRLAEVESPRVFLTSLAPPMF